MSQLRDIELLDPSDPGLHTALLSLNRALARLGEPSDLRHRRRLTIPEALIGRLYPLGWPQHLSRSEGGVVALDDGAALWLKRVYPGQMDWLKLDAYGSDGDIRTFTFYAAPLGFTTPEAEIYQALRADHGLDTASAAAVAPALCHNPAAAGTLVGAGG